MRNIHTDHNYYNQIACNKESLLLSNELSFTKIMKKILYISLGISVILLINIINILRNDLNRLTEYGYGYLVGKVILLLIFGTIILLTRKHKTESKN